MVREKGSSAHDGDGGDGKAVRTSASVDGHRANAAVFETLARILDALHADTLAVQRHVGDLMVSAPSPGAAADLQSLDRTSQYLSGLSQLSRDWSLAAAEGMPDLGRIAQGCSPASLRRRFRASRPGPTKDEAAGDVAFF